MSALFPMPSASVSNHSVASRGKASLSSKYPSLSSSVSTQLGIKSESVSNGVDVASRESEPQAISSWSLKPSLSSSVSIQLAIPSLSVSSGLEEASRGSVSQVISSWSLKPSLSSSESQAFPVPSPSVSN